MPELETVVRSDKDREETRMVQPGQQQWPYIITPHLSHEVQKEKANCNYET
jgi:hypothetical protein